MISESDLKNIEFYKDLYLAEIDRSRFYDNIIQYPTTIVVIFIGGVIYCFNKYFGNRFPDCLSSVDWTFTILLGFFLVSVGCTVYFLYSVFHGFSRRYSYLPLSSSLYNYEKELFKYNYKYSEKSTKDEKVNESKVLTCKYFSAVLKNYYIELADSNQRINDKRADKYYLTRTFLFIDLLLFVSIAIISFIK